MESFNYVSELRKSKLDFVIAQFVWEFTSIYKTCGALELIK